ncbi:hypothetical protein EOD40_00625 [Flavobacterium sufflavum]|uniref:Uncharacterized protein n=1 Tax=Flavobacterium sufflavum TaxID=1921138 RepID=A0A437L2W8_9FLAO|nr:hypothetical protein [Flavobacterium sufflavum]RVT79649.1 hypothetical protein EOD40_00625 [Flavobacterium sufflavum]
MNIIERIKAPTPKFFKRLRSIGLALLAISGSVIAAPVVLPSIVVSIAGYAALAGGVISAISQVTVDDASLRQAQGNNDSELDIKDALGQDQDKLNLPRDGTE